MFVGGHDQKKIEQQLFPAERRQNTVGHEPMRNKAEPAMDMPDSLRDKNSFSDHTILLLIVETGLP